MKFEELPRELLLHIFYYLPGDALWRNQRVCKKWKKRINPDVQKSKKTSTQVSSWTLLTEEQFPNELLIRKRYPTEIDYMYFYLYHLQTYIKNENRMLERIARSIEGVFEQSHLFTDICLLFPHLFANYVRIFKIQRYFFETDISDHIFWKKKLDVSKINITNIDSSGQKFTIIVKPNLKFIKEELEKSKYEGDAQSFVKEQVKELFIQWLSMYHRSIKKVPILSYYNLETCEILYTRKGFNLENFLKSGNNEVYKPAVYCLLAQNKLK